jgi:hypothetical protein
MAEGRVNGEPVSRAVELMLRDVLHFTKAPYTHNRDKDYRVVELRLIEIDGEFQGKTVVESADAGAFRYELDDETLVELGAELVNSRVG